MTIDLKVHFTRQDNLNAKKKEENNSFSSVQSLSCVRLFATSWTAARQASLSITNSWSSLKLTSIESVMPFNHLILCCLLLLLPSIFPSIRVFSNETVLHIRWPKYWSFRFSISPSNEYSGPISFRMDCVDHDKLWKIPKEMGIPDHLTCLLRNQYSGQEETERDMGQQTGSKLGKEYIKAVHCHLVFMQSTSCEMSGWMKHKLESRLPGER